VPRLFRIGRKRPPVRDVAERAAPRADIAEDHEGRGALAEALGDVRAGGFLAHRVQFLLAQDALDRVKARIRPRGAHADPGRLGERLARHAPDRDALRFGAAFLLDPRLTPARVSLPISSPA